MKAQTLTKTERFLLSEVDSVPDKVVGYSLLRAAMGRQLTSRGFGTVAERLMRRGLLAREYDSLTLTFGGMRALRSADQ